MPVTGLRVGVVGCGSGGPAAALYLARAGHQVELFERAPALEPIGTGFLLQPTGLVVLGELGLLAPVVASGARVDRLRSRTAGGRTLLDLEYGRLQPGAHGVGMHRATLLHFMVDALGQASVPIRLGCDVRSAPLEAGSRWIETAEARHGPYDLVVVANGAQSEARSWSRARARVRPYPWGALWTIAPDPEDRFPHCLSQVVDGTHTMLGLLPTGMRFDDATRSPMVSLFWSLRADHEARVRARGRAALHDAICALEPAAAGLLDGIESMGRWAWAGYWDVVMDRWHDPALVYLGDAGHAMSPQLGQGVNLALWDARTLARRLAVETSLASALASYTRERRRHLRFYQRMTRWLTPFFQSSIPAAGLVRDLAFPALGGVPFFEREMLATMAGVKTGVLGRMEIEAPPGP